MATHGIVISFLYFIFIIFNINRENFIYIIPILIVSLFQYAIFWGVSFLDIVFLHFLLFYKEVSNENTIYNR